MDAPLRWGSAGGLGTRRDADMPEPDPPGRMPGWELACASWLAKTKMPGGSAVPSASPRAVLPHGLPAGAGSRAASSSGVGTGAGEAELSSRTKCLGTGGRALEIVPIVFSQCGYLCLFALCSCLMRYRPLYCVLCILYACMHACCMLRLLPLQNRGSCEHGN